MGTKSRDRLYGSLVRMAAERAPPRLGKRPTSLPAMLGTANARFQGAAHPSPTLGDALDAGYLYLEVRCLGCDTRQTVALDTGRRPKTTPIHQLERHMRCKDCSEARGYPYKRSYLVALRTKISANDPPLDVVSG
jgi:hypothetical protein